MKSPAEIKKWLKTKRRNAIVLSATCSVMALAGGAVFLLPTIFLMYLTVKLMVLLMAPSSPFVSVWTWGMVALGIGLIYLDIFFFERDDMSLLPQWLFREFIHAGPRLTLEGIRQIFRAAGLARLDLDSCAKTLLYLASKTRSASKEELLQVFPELVWSKLIVHLRLIEGILFLQPNLSRLSLTSALRLELFPFAIQMEEPETPEENVPSVSMEEPHKLAPCEILGIDPSASPAEIKIAYRRRVKECHPDRFSRADEHSRELAEEWTKALNTAYESLLVQSRNVTANKK